MTAAEWLARAHAVTDGATPGPWEVVEMRNTHILAVAGAKDAWVADCGAGLVPECEADAAFIAASRTMLPAAVAAIEAVLALHKPVWCADRDSHHCVECGADLTDAAPDCPTIRAITAALDLS